MVPFLRRLLRASQWGSVLAFPAVGCSSQSQATTETLNAARGELEPAPELTCSGPVYDGPGFGFHGQCCEVALCVPPLDGECPPGDSSLPGYPPGSGACACSPLHGPYLNSDPSSADECCYVVGAIGCDGRPLTVDGAPRLPAIVRSPAWSADLPASSVPEPLDAETRARLSSAWTQRGRMEHASIASFGSFSLSLLALGAPPSLIRAAHEAAIDEIEHARACFGLASAYAGEPVGAGPLELDGALGDLSSLRAVTLATVVEGCVGETLAALEASAAAQEARGPVVRSALERIAEDETRHAELAWAFVQWAVSFGGKLALEVPAVFETAFRAALRVPSGPELPEGFGFLSQEATIALRRQAIQEILAPAATALRRPPEGPASRGCRAC